MRVFVALSALMALACAAPPFGYDNNNQINIGLPNGRNGEKYLPPASTTEAPTIHKKFYLVSAPEDHSNDGKTKHFVLGKPQRNYRVVFIKAPGPDNAGLKYSAEFAQQEEKTVIYVLSKKGDDLNADDIATPAPVQPSKPEVFFIKYKTEDEAQQAQKEIQGQYNKLGGTDEVSDEGTAPITSVVGSLDSLNPDGSYNYQQTNQVNGAVLENPQQRQQQQQQQQPNSQYLPSLFTK